MRNRQKHFRARQFSKKRVRRRFASLKLKRMVYAESPLEKACFRLLDFDKDVIDYREQPFKISYLSNGAKLHYTPDIEVIRRHKEQLIEVKPHDQLNDEESIRQFEVGRRYALENGYEYIVMTEKEIYGQLFDNIVFLYRYARQGEVPFPYRLEIKNILGSVESIVIEELAERLSIIDKNMNPIPYIFALIYQGEIHADLNQPINVQSKVGILT